MVNVICDPGSCHMGRLEYAKELIDVAVDAGANSVKFQLFKNLPPNIELPYEWFPELFEYGMDRKVEVFASAFDSQAVKLITKHCLHIKFSYSATKKMPFYDFGDTIPIFSSDFMGKIPKYKGHRHVSLYCIPEYPVKYEVAFDGVFPHFDGFSDHTIGYRQTVIAVSCGAQFIEKHITLDRSDINCPDNNFALKPKELKEMVKAIRSME